MTAPLIKLGSVPAVVIFASNPLELARWYQSAFELKVVVQQPNFIGLNAGTVMLFIQYVSEGHQPGPGGIRPHFTVEDCRGAYARLLEAGARSLLPATDLVTEWVAAIQDPEGNPVGLIQLKR